MTNIQAQTSARVVAVQDDLVSIEQVADDQGNLRPLMKNEVIYILPGRKTRDGRQEWLKAEVLRVHGNRADAQVYESTGGVAVGDPVVQSGGLLSAELGPGLLGMVYDGLQNPLEALAAGYGTFLPRGVELPALNEEKSWPFRARVKEGDTIHAGDCIGTVTEGHFDHQIMAPFDLDGGWTLDWIMQGSFRVTENIAQISATDGSTRQLQLRQRWPIRQPVSRALVQKERASREYPQTPLTTTLRLIDTFFPVAKGGTACIPGPFGAGKTVLQGLIARYSDVDIVIVVACGERAGEVVETIKEFPQMTDPKTGGTLMDRTIIICNTSSMPVAARETSVYTGITLAEYYQAMGYDVLLIADSTSRWAQAMRETSGRLEEIPGEEAFPAYLDSTIKTVYERAGVIRRLDGSGNTGTLTMIGTVSPAGGNFEEPVTQSTLSTVKTFLGLSADRAYRRYYPAVDPLLSWSRYFPQLSAWFAQNMDEHWVNRVNALRALLEKGEGINRMMQVTGEEGISAEDFIVSQKAQLLDMVYLQQDAFDAVDVSVPLPRQKALLTLLEQIIAHQPQSTDKSELRAFYTGITGQIKNLNYAAFLSSDYQRLLDAVVAEITAPEAA